MPTPDPQYPIPMGSPFYRSAAQRAPTYRPGDYGPPIYGEYRERYVNNEWIRADGSRAMHGLGNLGDTTLPTLDLSPGGATATATGLSTQAKYSFGAAAVALVAGLLLWKKTKLGAGIALGGAAAGAAVGFYFNSQGASALAQQAVWNATPGGTALAGLAAQNFYRRGLR